MKLSLSKAFDADSVIKIFSAAKITGVQDFVTSISDLSDKLISLSRRNVSLADNIDCEIKVLTLMHGQKISIQNLRPMGQVKHMLVSRVSSFDNPVTSFSWAYNANGLIDIKAQFLGNPTKLIDTTIIAYF